MDISNSFDTQILETLYLTKYKLFFRYALIQTKSERDAEELVHDSFCTALEKLESFNSSNNPEGWIMKTLKNKVSNFRPCLKNRGNCSNQQEGNGGKVKERQE